MKTVLLSGHRKSGTTLLARLFDGHECILQYPVDVSLLYAYFPKFSGDSDADDAQRRNRISTVLEKSLKLLPQTENTPSFYANPSKFVNAFWHNFDDSDTQRRADVIAALVDTVRDLNTAKCCADTVILKETSQAIHYEELCKAFSDFRLVNIIRDPRDNFAAIHDGFKYYESLGESKLVSLFSFVNRARMDLLAARSLAEAFPESVYNLRFEDLVSSPDSEMRKLTSFLQINWSDTLLAPTVFGVPYTGNNHRGISFSGISGMHVGRWRERMSDFYSQVIEFSFYDLMEFWGYHRVFSMTDAMRSYAKFYDLYNKEFFFFDRFGVDGRDQK